MKGQYLVSITDPPKPPPKPGPGFWIAAGALGVIVAILIMRSITPHPDQYPLQSPGRARLSNQP